ncbi:MAG: hypothetical protein OEQ29_10885 [Alphaproteobacteria bacterium]|nr:hypothetical protein [Alphaproteobacteria bacterium]
MAKMMTVAPQLAVSDVMAAAGYYRDVLGFDVAGTFGDPPVHAIVERDAVQLFLGRSVSGAAASNRSLSPTGIDAYIWIEGLDDLITDLKHRGADIIEGPVTRVYGMREIVIRDLNGFVLAFGEDVADAA